MTRRDALKLGAIGVGGLLFAPALELINPSIAFATATSIDTFENAPIFDNSTLAARPIWNENTSIEAFGDYVLDESFWNPNLASWWIRSNNTGFSITNCGTDLDGDAIDLRLTVTNLFEVYPQSSRPWWNLMIEVCDEDINQVPIGQPCEIDINILWGAEFDLELSYLKHGTNIPANLNAFATPYDFDFGNPLSYTWIHDLFYQGRQGVCVLDSDAEVFVSSNSSLAVDKANCGFYEPTFNGNNTDGWNPKTAITATRKAPTLNLKFTGSGRGGQGQGFLICWRAPIEFVGNPTKTHQLTS